MTVNPQDCTCSAVIDTAGCLWPILHKDMREMTEINKYRSVPVGVLMSNDLKLGKARG